jgi:hemoglobin-like flavoprotein
MTEDQIILIRRSWGMLQPDAPQAGHLLYEKLFATLPQVRHFFKDDVDEQACKLAALITFVVSKLHRFPDIFPDLLAIGEKHKHYHIPEAWYDAVGNCLVQTIKESTGSSWNTLTEEAWTVLYNELKSKVLEGAQLKTDE